MKFRERIVLNRIQILEFKSWKVVIYVSLYANALKKRTNSYLLFSPSYRQILSQTEPSSLVGRQTDQGEEKNTEFKKA